MSGFLNSAKKQAEQYNEDISLKKINEKLNLPVDSKITPMRVLEYISKDYSGLWGSIEKFAVDNLISPKWDRSIFVPTLFWLPTLLEIRYPNWRKGYKGKNMPIWGLDFFSICAIGTWRYTKGIYKLDDDVAKHFFVDDSDIKIPSYLLEKQPEWSIFVDTQNLDLELNGKKVVGFWSNISCLPTEGSPYSDNKILVIVPLFEDGVGYLLSASIPLSEDTILTIEQGTQTLVANLPHSYVEDKRSSDELKQLNSFKKRIVQILLFIIQPEPDVSEHNKAVNLDLNKPQLKATKGKYRLFEAKKPRYFDVGQGAGNALRSALAGYKGVDKKQTPHIRKAHWHGYWKGSKKENTQEFFYKWIPPVVVNQYAENDLEQVSIT